MASDADPLPRPRRERPLVAPGRESKTQLRGAAAESTPPSVSLPPTGPLLMGSPSSADVASSRHRVEVLLDGPTLQKRWTVALRALLVVPHLIWLWMVNLAAVVLVVVVWFAALVTGQVPKGLSDFVRIAVRYQARVLGYGFLFLSDRYPSFDLHEEDDAVEVLASPGQLNRLAVFFRFVLVLPSMVLGGLAVLGALLISSVAWLLTLVLRRLPTPLWQANAAVVRYVTRGYAFAYMLTAEHPKGYLGDDPMTRDVGVTRDEHATPALPPRPRVSRLVLSRSAKRIVVSLPIVAALFYVGFVTVATITGTRLDEAERRIIIEHDRLERSVVRFDDDLPSCAVLGGGLTCLHEAESRLASAYERFSRQLESTSVPANVDASTVIADAELCATALRQAEVATDNESHNSALAEFRDARKEFDEHFRNLEVELRFN